MINGYLKKDGCEIVNPNLKSVLVQKGYGAKQNNKLILDLFETKYLFDKRKLSFVYINNKPLTKKQLDLFCKKQVSDFENKFFVFKHYRDIGLIIKEALSFGFDFRVYESKSQHTKWVVDVKHSNKEDITKLIKSQRLAHSIGAKYVLAVVDKGKIIKLQIDRL